MELLLLEALPEGSALPNEADILSIAMESVFLENSAPDGRENEVDSIVDECLSLIEVCGLFYSFSLYPPSIVTLSCLYAAVQVRGMVDKASQLQGLYPELTSGLALDCLEELSLLLRSSNSPDILTATRQVRRQCMSS